MSATFTTPDLCDTYDEINYQSNLPPLLVLEPIFHAFGGKKSFSGQIVTVKCHEDNSLVKEQLSQAGEGRVLVVDGGGSLRCALLGDQLAAQAVKNNWSGIVVFGCVRDVTVLAQMDLGIQALAAHPRKSVRKGRGDLNLVVQFAGVVIHPHHYIYVDENGIVVSSTILSLQPVKFD